MKKEKKDAYETPKIEIIIFELEDSIATSSLGSTTMCGNEVFTGGF